MAIRCTRCCLWCLEKCLQFITGYAYIFVALNGDSFCTAAHDTLRLLTAYPATALLSHYVQSLLFAVQSLLLPNPNPSPNSNPNPNPNPNPHLYQVQSLLLPVLCALASVRLVERDALPGWLSAAQAAADDATHQASDGLTLTLTLTPTPTPTLALTRLPTAWCRPSAWRTRAGRGSRRWLAEWRPPSMRASLGW